MGLCLLTSQQTCVYSLLNRQRSSFPVRFITSLGKGFHFLFSFCWDYVLVLINLLCALSASCFLGLLKTVFFHALEPNFELNLLVIHDMKLK